MPPIHQSTNRAGDPADRFRDLPHTVDFRCVPPLPLSIAVQAVLGERGMVMKALAVLLLLSGLQVCQPAIAGSTFRCEVDGRTEFSDRPCQPVKRKASCPAKESEGRSGESLHGHCPAPATDGRRPSVLAAAAYAALGNQQPSRAQ